MPFLLLLFSFIDMLFFLILYLFRRTEKEKYSVAVIMSVIMLLLCGNLYFVGNSENIRYLKNRPKSQHEAIQAESDIPWLVFYKSQSPEWILLCSFYDFQIPEMVKKIDIEQEASPDITLRNEEGVIVYTIESKKTIEDCCKYIEDSSVKQQGQLIK